MSFAMDDFDLKHLKKGKFGPLDIYPQEEKQKEVNYHLIKYKKYETILNVMWLIKGRSDSGYSKERL